MNLIHLPVEILQLLPDTYLNGTEIKKLHYTCKRLHYVFTPFVFRRVKLRLPRPRTDARVTFPFSNMQFVHHVSAEDDCVLLAFMFFIEHQSHCLKSISVDATSNFRYLWSAFFQCHRLESLSFHVSSEVEKWDLEELSKSLDKSRPFWPKLKKLNITREDFDAKSMQFVLGNAPALEYLYIPNLEHGFDYSIVQSYPSTLTEIAIAQTNFATGMFIKEFFMILNSCPNLRKFETIPLLPHNGGFSKDLSFPKMLEFQAIVLGGHTWNILNNWKSLFPNLEKMKIRTWDGMCWPEMYLEDEENTWKSMKNLTLVGENCPGIDVLALALPNVESLFLEMEDYHSVALETDLLPRQVTGFSKLTQLQAVNMTDVWVDWLVDALIARGKQCPPLKYLSFKYLFEDDNNYFYSSKSLLRLLEVVAEDVEFVNINAPADFEPESLLRFEWRGCKSGMKKEYRNQFRVVPDETISQEMKDRWDQVLQTLRERGVYLTPDDERIAMEQELEEYAKSLTANEL